MAKWTGSLEPIQVNRFNKAWRSLEWEVNTYTQITGVIGGEERRTVLTSVFGSGATKNATAQGEISRIGEKFSWTVNKENLPELLTDIASAIEKAQANRPVEDRRETIEVKADRAREYEENVKKNEADHLELEKAINLLSEESILVPKGTMAVTIAAYCDQSDAMTDYFDRHHSLINHYALTLIPMGAQTEAAARAVVMRIPELAKLTWTWGKQDYSMGHGYWLESDGIGKVNYRGEEVYYWYEIQFNKWLEGKDITKSRLFLEPKPAKPVTAGGNGNGVTIRRNEEHNGIEVVFPAKPGPSVIQHLKASGYRWSRPQSLWYTKYTPEKLAAIRQHFQG